MKSRASITAMALLALGLGGGPGVAAAQDTWEPFNFGNTRLIELDVAVTEAGATQTGNTRMAFEDVGNGQVRLSFRATLGEMESEFTTTAAEDQLYSQAMVQIMMNPAAAPLMTTLFAPYWGMFFVGRDLSIGSGWSFSDGSESFSFTVESACSQAGLDGMRIVWRENDAVRADACVNSQVPLPLSLTLNAEDDKTYQVTMTRYEPRN